ncbi:MAG: 30S ribosomal protein S30 [Candidatus Korarchaeota archaeon]|nr:30S ribosomal protein S30 [Candidatus Korarchaeota archaeon]
MPTHGALSKAGKVRSLSDPKKDRSKLRPNPRVKNRRKYNNRVILERNAHRGTQGGQYRPGQRRYRRRRRR